MGNRVHTYLRALGCRSVPAGGLKSCGLAFHARKRLEAERDSGRLFWAQRAALREQRLADRERLKQLGGVPRSADEEREWHNLISRNPDVCLEYFEKRLFERTETRRAAG